MRSSVLRAVAAIVGLTLSARAAAQTETVMLRVQPRVGDTLRTRFAQDVEMTGRTKLHGKDTTFVSRTSLLILARIIVQASDSTGCTLLAITDSVSVLTVQSQALLPVEAARRAMQGREILLRVRPDGSASFVHSPADLEPEVSALVSSMPAVLSPRPVAVGASWVSAMTVPGGGDSDAGHGVQLHAVYKLDSLSEDGAHAYIGLLGVVTRDSAGGAAAAGARLASRGSVSGGFVFDRRRGWWSDASFRVTLGSTIIPKAAPGGAPSSAPPPVRVQTRITQQIHTEGPRGSGAPPG